MQRPSKILILLVVLLCATTVYTMLRRTEVRVRKFAPLPKDMKAIRASRDGETIARSIDRFETAEAREIRTLLDLKSGYLTNIDTLKDPWGSPYQLDIPGRRVFSRGPDGRAGTDDDTAFDLPPLPGGLFDAARDGRLDEAREFLKADPGAINGKSGSGLTPLRYAVAGEQADMIGFLIASGADATIPDGDGVTPLHYAAATGRLKAIAALLDRRIDVDLRDRGRGTPLHAAALRGREDSAKALIGRGADVNARDEAQRTPLHAAVADESLDNAALVRLLCEAKAAPNVLDDRLETPLALATRGFTVHEEVVKQLLEHGADPTLSDSQGHTPLENLVRSGHRALADLLRARGAR